MHAHRELREGALRGGAELTMYDRARLAVLAPALLVGVCAVAATAHGGYEVAVASQVPEGLIAGLYPAITDGLALVAYAATHRLQQRPARVYAWAVVVLAAALSGVAQAVYLASGPALITAPELRFGVGAWPAVAGAVAAHLVYLLAQRRDVAEKVSEPVAPTVADLVADRTEPERVALHLAPEPTLNSELNVEIPPVKRTSPAIARQTTSRARVAELAPDLAEKAAPLIAQGFGRATLAGELGITTTQARKLLDDAKAGT